MRRALIFVPFVVATTASAQPTSSKTLADQLFKQGRDLAKANNWAEACPKFEGSLQDHPAVGTKLNLATCYEWIGRPASAWGLYREVIEETTRTHDAKRLAIAKKAAAKLEPTLPKLAIIAPTPAPPGLVIERDGVVIAAAELGTPIYVDPGPHHIKASAPGFVPFEHDITAEESKAVSDPLPPLEAAPVAVTPPPPPITPPPINRAPAPPSHRRTFGLVAGVGGLAVAGVGLAFGAKANGKLSDAKSLCGADLVCSPENFTAGQGLIDDSRSAATLSTVFVVAGGVALATGVVLFLTAPSHASERVALVPVITGQQAGVVALGHF